jgi:Cft2 family RNA processing exonuclease
VDNWCKGVKTIFETCNMLHHFINPLAHNRRNIILILERIKDNIMERYITAWKNQTSAMPKLRTYKLVKQNYGVSDLM